MELFFIISLAVFMFLHCAQGQEDCHRTANYYYQFATWSHQCSYVISYTASGSWTGFNCGPDYDCCENACCKRNSETVRTSDMETVGVVLSATAMFTIIILALMIVGVTFCSDKEDESKLFSKGRN